MKSATLIGILLVVLGIAALAYEGFSYKSDKKILDIGPFEATTETTKTVPISPIIGAIAVIGGVALVVATARGGASAA